MQKRRRKRIRRVTQRDRCGISYQSITPADKEISPVFTRHALGLYVQTAQYPFTSGNWIIHQAAKRDSLFTRQSGSDITTFQNTYDFQKTWSTVISIIVGSEWQLDSDSLVYLTTATGIPSHFLTTLTEIVPRFFLSCKVNASV
jgi:hypothetical protein